MRTWLRTSLMIPTLLALCATGAFANMASALGVQGYQDQLNGVFNGNAASGTAGLLNWQTILAFIGITGGSIVIIIFILAAVDRMQQGMNKIESLKLIVTIGIGILVCIVGLPMIVSSYRGALI